MVVSSSALFYSPGFAPLRKVNDASRPKDLTEAVMRIVLKGGEYCECNEGEIY